MTEDVLIEEIKESDERKPTHKDKTASHLAYVIVLTFAISVILSFGMSIYRMVRNIELLEKSFEIFKTISAVLSGPLGFVLGYYFRESRR